MRDTFEYANYWTPETRATLERWMPITLAAAALTYGLSRRSSRGVCAALAVTPLAYRAMTGHWPGYIDALLPTTDSREALAGDRGIHVREAIRIEKPIAEVYRFWRQLDQLPQFMSHLERVTELGDGRSHWVVKGPGGLNLEWDAKIINEVENKVIGWQSLPDADVVTAGSVVFAPGRSGQGTQVSVHLQYAPPAGQLGAFVATAFGREPSQTIREDLRRLKQLLEAGEVPRTAAPSASTNEA